MCSEASGTFWERVLYMKTRVLIVWERVLCLKTLVLRRPGKSGTLCESNLGREKNPRALFGDSLKENTITRAGHF